MIGILAEKSSAAQNFAKALGGMQGVYKGQPYIIVSAKGHLYEFAQPHEQVATDKSGKYKAWNMDNLPWDENDFKWKRVRKKTATLDYMKSLRKSLLQCDEIVIATDVDPSGEGNLIAWEIFDELKLAPRVWSRMPIIDESEKKVREAFDKRFVLKSMMHDPDFLKADFRSKYDMMTMQFTRIATCCGDGKSVLRQGRLKSAMISIVGDQLEAIKAYKKIPFYCIRFKDENGITYKRKVEDMKPTKQEVPTNFTNSAIISSGKVRKKSAPPKMLDLASLSSILSEKGVKAQDVLSVYQKMYEAKIVSYPRTDDKFITPEQFNEMLPLVDKIASVVGVNPSMLTVRQPRKTHVKEGGAHGANRPGLTVPNSLADLDKFGKCARMIYEILAKNYLATLAPDYEYDLEKGVVSAYPDFEGSAHIPVFAGYKAIYNQDDDADAEVSNVGLGTTGQPFIHEGFPPKPQKPSMKWLMKQLEKRGVGTGATRTSTYSDVTSTKVKYPLLTDKKGVIGMTINGDMSYYLLKDTHIGSIELAENLQTNMKLVAEGKANPKQLLQELQQLVIEDRVTMKRNGEAMRKELGINKMEFVQKEKYEGVWSKTGQTVKFSRQHSTHRFTDAECEALLSGAEIEVTDLISKAGKPYGIKGKLEEQTYNGNKFVGFLNLGFLNSGNVPDVWCKYTFTDAEKQKLEAGESIQIKGAVSAKTGNSFDCTVTFKEEKGQKRLVPSFG